MLLNQTLRTTMLEIIWDKDEYETILRFLNKISSTQKMMKLYGSGDVEINHLFYQRHFFLFVLDTI